MASYTLYVLVVICVGVGSFFVTFYSQTAHIPPGNLERKVGHLVAICIRVDSSRAQIERACQLINRYNIGSVLLCGAGVWQQSPLEHDIEAINIIRSMCKKQPLIMQDFERGPAFFLTGVPSLPWAMTCGAIQDDKLIYRYGRAVGRMCKILGVDIVLAPVVDVNSNPANPIIGTRSYGSDPGLVARKAVEFMRGVAYEGVGACAKHFPGHGDTALDSHEELQTITRSKEALEATEFYPFKKMIEAGVPCVMSAHILVRAFDDKPATLSRVVMTDVLRSQLGFEGAVISDALNMGALTNYFDQATLALNALKAGCDILLAPEHVELAIKTIADAVRKGQLSEQELLAHVNRVAQLRSDFLHLPKVPLSLDEVVEQLNDPSFAALNRDLYRAAVTLVRDQQRLLPISGDRPCKYLQVGGTPDMLLSRKLVARLPLIDHMLVPAQAHMTEHERADVIARVAGSVVILALFDVDAPGKRRALVSHELQTFVADVCAQAKTVIALVCGNPYSLASLPSVPTVLMAYEDAPEAQDAIADVLFGDLEARGRLPIAV